MDFTEVFAYFSMFVSVATGNIVVPSKGKLLGYGEVLGDKSAMYIRVTLY
jgi:hypothetical protein